MKFYVRKIDGKYLSFLAQMLGSDPLVDTPILATMYDPKEVDVFQDAKPYEDIVEWEITEKVVRPATLIKEV